MNHYNSLTVGELESLALRESQIEPYMEQLREFCLAMSDYHKSEDFLWDYFPDSHSIMDAVVYEGTFKARLMEALGDDLSQSEYEYILEGIASGLLTTDIKKSYMNMDPSSGCIGVCSMMMGEECEEVPDSLMKLIDGYSITEDEVNKGVDAYYSSGCFYFDYSYYVVFIEVSIEDIENLLEEYRGE